MSPQVHAPPYPDRKPRDDEMDIFGVTHPGKVRSENQDQFLVCSLRKEAVIHQTSLPETSNLTPGSERVALLMMVADGVGGGQKGAEASRIAISRPSCCRARPSTAGAPTKWTAPPATSCPARGPVALSGGCAPPPTKPLE